MLSLNFCGFANEIQCIRSEIREEKPKLESSLRLDKLMISGNGYTWDDFAGLVLEGSGNSMSVVEGVNLAPVIQKLLAEKDRAEETFSKNI